MELEDFRSRQRTWLSWLAYRVGSEQLRERFGGLSRLNDVEAALVCVHVGVGHLLGVDDADLAMNNIVDAQTCTSIISRWWRSGSADPLTSSQLLSLWIGLFQLSRDHGAASELLLAGIIASRTYQLVRPLTEQDLRLHSQDGSALGPLLTSVRPIDTDRIPGGRFPWEADGSHLPMLRGLIHERGLEALAGKVSLLELTAALFAGPDDVDDVDALEEATHVNHIYLSIPGAWPGPTADDVPEWVRDIVTVQGARMFQSSVSFVPGLLYVAENEEELSGVNRWSYNQALGYRDAEDGAVELVIPVEFGPDDVGYLTYRYRLDDRTDLIWLRTMVAIGLARFELYRLDTSRRLQWVATFAIQLPEELKSFLRSKVTAASPENALFFHEHDGEAWLTMFEQIERSMFETLALARSHAGTGDSVERSYKHYLRLSDSVTRTNLSGGLVDMRTLNEAHQAFRVAVSHYPALPIKPLDLSVLGPGRALIQFVLTMDEPVSLRANAAYVDGDGNAVAKTYEFSVTFNPFHLYDSLDWLSNYLASALSEMCDLLQRGIRAVVLEVGAGIYHLPFHDAFLAMGFEEASYAHRLSLLGEQQSAADAEEVRRTLVAGFAGKGGEHLDQVAVELDIVAELEGPTIVNSIEDELPAVVHLAGHAETGSNDYEVGIWVEATSPLSASRVLLDLDASRTELVYLSGCSTGVGKFAGGELIAAVPLDVAFLEKGATVVISTQAPVNDQVAAFFACVFHAHYSNGRGPWASYQAARLASSTGRLDEVDSELRQHLDAQWLTWESDIKGRLTLSPGEWRLFRISGRHW